MAVAHSSDVLANMAHRECYARDYSFASRAGGLQRLYEVVVGDDNSEVLTLSCRYELARKYLDSFTDGRGRADVSHIGGCRFCKEDVVSTGSDAQSSSGVACGIDGLDSKELDDGSGGGSDELRRDNDGECRNSSNRYNIRDDGVCSERLCSESVVVGKNTERNRQWRKEKKEKKNRRKQGMQKEKQGSFKSCSGSDFATPVQFENDELQRKHLELKMSSAMKWKAQNELAMEKAHRELHVLRQNDIQSEVQRYRTKVSAATERNMVSIEKTHGLLKASGNVPGFHGSVETVVDGEIVSSSTPELTSGSISPDSSISQAEARKAQKDLLDSQGEVVKLKEKLALITRKAGFSAEHFELYDKNTWTENDDNEALLDELYPEGYVVNREYCAAGKFQLR